MTTTNTKSKCIMTVMGLQGEAVESGSIQNKLIILCYIAKHIVHSLMSHNVVQPQVVEQSGHIK